MTTRPAQAHDTMGARPRRARPILLAALFLAGMVAPITASAQRAAAEDSAAVALARQVEIRRTAYGVPHIRAQNLRAAGFALGWVQVEDYGARIPLFLLKGRGELARHFGRDSLESDLQNRPNWLRAVDSYHRLDADTRDVYEGFAAGVNRYVRLHPAEFPGWLRPDFSGIDALTTDMELPGDWGMRRVLERLGLRPDSGLVPGGALEGAPRAPAPVPQAEGEHADVERGSNAWALGPGRTKSHRAILLRNPHLDWSAGYYELQLTVPGVLDFYGDIQVGGPFRTVGGFNRRLGWATTNNDPDVDEVYALDADPARPDHVLFDGTSIPLRRETTTVEVLEGSRLTSETRERWHSPLGPVVARAGGKVYVWSVTGVGDWRLGQMWLRLMRASSLAEWKQGMRMLAKPYSNFIYADAAGNIFYVWGGQIPRLPRPSGGDSVAVPARTSADVWSSLVPFDSLPQLLNPPGGYLHNENDPFHYTNLRRLLSAADFPPYFPRPDLRLRSQLALQLIGGNERLSLQDVIRLKHSMRMLLADRVKPDLLAALRAARVGGDTALALELLARWDNTAAADSRGGVLFRMWWQRYRETAPLLPGDPTGQRALYRKPWTAANPTGTPEGVADPQRAVSAFGWAVRETARRFGSLDVAWGDVSRVRIDTVDVPVGGCPGSMGCFRVLYYSTAPDGKFVADDGDGWILAVEFTDPPRAYSILAYGESARPASLHHSDQAGMFARGQLKPVAFTEEQIRRETIRRYHPGLQDTSAP